MTKVAGPATARRNMRIGTLTGLGQIEEIGMTKKWLWLFLLGGATAFAQAPGVVLVGTAPSGNCPQGAVGRLVNSTGIIWTCQSIVAGTGTWTATGGSGSMTWPAGGAGIPNYNGSSAWDTSYSATN